MKTLGKLVIALLVFILITAYRVYNLENNPIEDFAATMIAGAMLTYMIVILHLKKD